MSVSRLADPQATFTVFHPALCEAFRAYALHLRGEGASLPALGAADPTGGAWASEGEHGTEAERGAERVDPLRLAGVDGGGP